MDARVNRWLWQVGMGLLVLALIPVAILVYAVVSTIPLALILLLWGGVELFGETVVLLLVGGAVLVGVGRRWLQAEARAEAAEAARAAAMVELQTARLNDLVRGLLAGVES